MKEEKAFTLITTATIDRDGKRNVGLYAFQAETPNTFLSRNIAMNGA